MMVRRWSGERPNLKGFLTRAFHWWTEHLSRGSGHLEVDISGGPLQDGLLSQRERVAGVDTVLLTPAVNTHLEKWKSGICVP